MTIETRLESLERSVHILNTTIRELINLYLDTQLNPILGDLPKTAGFTPKVIKDRNARNKKKDGINITMLEIRELTEQLIEIKGIEFTSRILRGYNISSLAELPIGSYENYYNDLMEAIDGTKNTHP